MKKDFFKAEDFCPMFASHPAVDTSQTLPVSRAQNYAPAA